jgi:hypothetical protein
MSSALLSATGDDWGIAESPGFKESFVYRVHVETPTARAVNYADGGERCGSSPYHFYMAARTGRPAFSDFAMQSLEKDFEKTRSEKYAKNMDRKVNRFLPLAAAWYLPDSKAEKRDLDWFASGKSRIHLALMRSAWDDADAIFASLKAGDLNANHGHLDTGSFILEALGQRWAYDLGSEKEIYDRGDAWSRAQDSFRWKFFRANNLSHNTLTIDGRIQQVKGSSPIIKTGSGDSPFAVADLTPAYQGQAESVKRGIMLPDRKAVIIRDEITGVPEGQVVTWNMTTRAEIQLDASRKLATLDSGGKQVTFELQSEAGKFSVKDAKPEMDIENQNDGWRRLQVEIECRGKPLTIQVVFFPGERFSTDQTPLVDWRAH